MTRPVVPSLGPYPQRGEDFDTFTAKINARFASEPAFTNAVNALGDFVEVKADSAAQAATTAADAAAAAADRAGRAEDEANRAEDEADRAEGFKDFAEMAAAAAGAAAGLPALVGQSGKALTVKDDESGVEWGRVDASEIGDRLLSSQPSKPGYVEADQIYQIDDYPALFGVVGQMEPQEFPNARRTDLFEGGAVTDIRDAYATEDGTVVAVACSVAPGIRVFRWDAGSAVFQPVSLTGSVPTQLPDSVTGTPDGEYLVFSYSGSPRVAVLKRDGLSYAHMQNLSSANISTSRGHTTISNDGQYICTNNSANDPEGRERVWRRQGSVWSLLPAASELSAVVGWRITGDGKRIFTTTGSGTSTVGQQLTVDGNDLKDLSEFASGVAFSGQVAVDYAGQVFLAQQSFVRYDPATNEFSTVPVASHNSSTSVFDNRGVAWTIRYSGNRTLLKRLFEGTTEHSYETPVNIAPVSGSSSPHVYSAAARSLIAFYPAETTGYMDYPYDPVSEFYIPGSVPEQLSALNLRVSTPVKEFVKAE